MRTLTLLRHAKSGWDDPAIRDFDRPLNAKGARAAAVIGGQMRALGMGFDTIIASPALRVMETVDHLGRGYGRRIEPEWDRRLYLASAAMLLDLVHALPPEAERVLLIGHNPGLAELALLLAPDESAGTLRRDLASKYPTASLAELTIVSDWAKVLPGEGRLERFIRPRDLDATLGPDE